MKAQPKRSSAVIFAPFGCLPISPTSGAPAKILPFKMRSMMKKEELKRKNAEQYVDMLVREKLISQAEEQILRWITGALTNLFRDIDLVTVKLVQEEHDGEERPRYTALADEEAGYWHEALKRGKNPLPGLAYEQCLSMFTVPPEKRKQNVAFLKPEFVKELPVPEVPYELHRGYARFHLILRMFRQQHECSARSEKIMLAEIKAMAEQIRSNIEQLPELRFKKTLWQKLRDFLRSRKL